MGSFKNGDFALGDQVSVSSQGGSRQFPLVGVVRFGDVDSPGGATFALFDTADRGELRRPARDGRQHRGQGRRLASPRRSSPAGCSKPCPRVSRCSPASRSPRRTSPTSSRACRSSTSSCWCSPASPSSSASFIIYNTFSIIVAQRQQGERAAPGHRRQPAPGPRLAAHRVGRHRVSSRRCSGIALGVLAAELLEALLSQFGVDIPSSGLVLLPRTIIVSLIVGHGHHGLLGR